MGLVASLTGGLARAELPSFPVEFRLGFAYLADDTSGASFSGTPPGGAAQTFQGRDVGFVNARLFGAEAEALSRVGAVTLGAVGGFALGSGPDQSPGTPPLANALVPGNLKELRVAVAPGLRHAFERWPGVLSVELRAGARWQNFPANGQSSGCITNGCVTYSHSELYLQPAVRLGFGLGAGFEVGLFAAADAAPGPLHQVLGGLDFATSALGF